MEYLTYDRSEYMVSDFSEACLDMIERFLGWEVRDLLYVPVVEELVEPHRTAI